MFILNIQVVHIFFCSIHFSQFLCEKSEIKFDLYNVPTVLRYAKEGRLYHFGTFPSDDKFYASIGSTKKATSDLSLLPVDQRFIIKLDKLEVLCEDSPTIKSTGEIFYFSSKCSTELCRRHQPSTATIFSESVNRETTMSQINLVITSDSAVTQLVLSHFSNEEDLKKNVSLRTGEIRTHQIIFKNKDNVHFDMMCDSEEKKQQPWSWICYYYPWNTEAPYDRKLIYQMAEEYRKTNLDKKPILLREFDLGADNNSSLNKTDNTDASKSTLFVVIAPIVIGGMYYFYKKSSKDEIKKRNSRLSEDSQDSRESIDDVLFD
ncbi:unnamed protein product [Adineta ricciae]|uniref:Uncharacterized protein n=1 Tax=Adineta ricciae TaxID=249248 RepID=A0A814BDS4_ADIRI|nr:unnamed protein product [Adineta ricciae]